MSLRLAGGGEAAEEWLFLVTRFLEHVPTAPTGTYREGDVIDTGAHRFEAIHTPGHTADHFCFLDKERGILLSFDFDLTPFGPWYGHEESDLDQLHESFRKIRAAAPRMIVSSHREPVSSGIEEKLDAYEEVIAQRGEKVLACVSSVPATPETIADSSPIYGFQRDQQSALFHYFESRMIEKHLEWLAREGALERNEAGSFRRAH
jgi:glyoxylase-like metal-dependent hydrolase (beta-lactamase superfamily II)